MLYIKKDAGNVLRATVENQTSSVTTWKIVFTNDIAQVEYESTFTPTATSRCIVFNITEPTNIDFANQEGSYTYKIFGDSVLLEQGKARVYDGSLTGSGQFGDEVTYTEHDNTTTNTQYITI